MKKVIVPKGGQTMSGWFHEVFLPSLYERAEIDRALRISEKQVDVCTRNMDRIETGYSGHPRVHFESDFNGRPVKLFVYSGRFGEYGEIIFGCTQDERDAFARTQAIREATRINGHLHKLMLRDKEKALSKINQIRSDMQYAEEDGEEEFVELCKIKLCGF